MKKCCANCANGSQNCKPNEKDPSRCELFCQGGNYDGFIPKATEEYKNYLDKNDYISKSDGILYHEHYGEPEFD